jgi:hypothetical protein
MLGVLAPALVLLVAFEPATTFTEGHVTVPT